MHQHTQVLESRLMSVAESYPLRRFESIDALSANEKKGGREQEDRVKEGKKERSIGKKKRKKLGAAGLILVSSAVTPDASTFETRCKPGATFDEVRWPSNNCQWLGGNWKREQQAGVGHCRANPLLAIHHPCLFHPIQPLGHWNKGMAAPIPKVTPFQCQFSNLAWVCLSILNRQQTLHGVRNRGQPFP